VRDGFECGIGVENFNDIKVGDVLECYKKEQVARTLSGTGELAISGPTISGSGRVTALGRRGSEGAPA
jgi:hypothetical protein